MLSRYFMTLLCIKNLFPYEPILWLSFSYYSHETCFCYVSETWKDERKSRRMETTQRENNQCAKVFLSERMLQSCYGGLILKCKCSLDYNWFWVVHSNSYFGKLLKCNFTNILFHSVKFYFIIFRQSVSKNIIQTMKIVVVFLDNVWFSWW